MNDLKITKGEWRSTVPLQGKKAEIRADGAVIATASSPIATNDAAVMASAPRMYDVLTDMLIFLRDPKNKNKKTSKEWTDIIKRINDIIANLPKK